MSIVFSRKKETAVRHIESSLPDFPHLQKSLAKHTIGFEKSAAISEGYRIQTTGEMTCGLKEMTSTRSLGHPKNKVRGENLNLAHKNFTGISLPL